MSSVMVSSSEALIAVADNILNSIADLNKVEYNKKGRKYRFVNNNFQRIREEDKHLIICPEDPSLNLSSISAFYILYNINNGEILQQFPDFCLSIIGVARKLEMEKWNEVENSSVVHYNNARFDPMVIKDLALSYLEDYEIQPRHIEMGLNLMLCAKLNFLHTDHHIGTKLEGYYMKHYVQDYYGPEALESSDVLVALKSFVHWGNIKGFLYKLDVPNINVSQELIDNFASFPEPSAELKASVYDRYPSGTSKYSLIRKSIDILGDWKYSKLIPFPTSEEYDLSWLYALCHDIETDPIRYHLRSVAKGMCLEPVNLTELTNTHSHQVKSLLELISLIINIFHDTGGEFLLQNSKIPKLTNKLIESNKELYQTLLGVCDGIDNYEEKDWDSDDIVIRLGGEDDDGEHKHTLFNVVMDMRQKYIDDYE
ncbi:uncharacterized protein RJT20DRAFT_31372 [Scheffersomyces xylosifermentans]|uniref:uncharacterized protein n=1 Tax=Scheffersomyces xylosifermentans TaxID=1304137 RepID=UPI00315D9045